MNMARQGVAQRDPGDLLKDLSLAWGGKNDSIFLVFAIIRAVNSKHHQTLEDIFSEPVDGNIEWSRIEALLVAIGCRVIEGSGSSVTFEKDGRKASFHRPHPRKEALRYRIKQVREYLQQLEIAP